MLKTCIALNTFYAVMSSVLSRCKCHPKRHQSPSDQEFGDISLAIFTMNLPVKRGVILAERCSDSAVVRILGGLSGTRETPFDGWKDLKNPDHIRPGLHLHWSVDGS